MLAPIDIDVLVIEADGVGLYRVGHCAVEHSHACRSQKTQAAICFIKPSIRMNSTVNCWSTITSDSYVVGYSDAAYSVVCAHCNLSGASCAVPSKRSLGLVNASWRCAIWELRASWMTCTVVYSTVWLGSLARGQYKFLIPTPPLKMVGSTQVRSRPGQSRAIRPVHLSKYKKYKVRFSKHTHWNKWAPHELPGRHRSRSGQYCISDPGFQWQREARWSLSRAHTVK